MIAENVDSEKDHVGIALAAACCIASNKSLVSNDMSTSSSMASDLKVNSKNVQTCSDFIVGANFKCRYFGEVNYFFLSPQKTSCRLNGTRCTLLK